MGSCRSSNDECEILLISDIPHPFAVALKEYMANYDDVVSAYLVTLDDNGAIGVLTSRIPVMVRQLWNEPDEYIYFYEPLGTLFYLQNDELYQMNANRVFVSGRYNRLLSRIYAHTHIVEFVYKLEYNKLVVSTRLEYFSDDYLLYLLDDYDIAAKFITERDYIREKYGLGAPLPLHMGRMQNTECQTAQILAMTINCIPRINQPLQ